MMSESQRRKDNRILTPGRIAAFRRKIFRFYRQHGRDLPFRRTTDPYRIAVAEIMLQQTQVDRVLPKYGAWLKKWPTWQRLAHASERELLTMWSGLGYNRRALFLGRLARIVVRDYGGRLPNEPEILATLPGIGPYTARAILIFADNQPLAAVDANIRRVLLHEFNLPPSISPAELAELADKLLPRKRSRDWHNALMDYSRLALASPTVQIAPASRQPQFAGSQRQIRGEIIRRLTHQSRVSYRVIARELNRTLNDVRAAATSLAREGIVRITAHTIRLERSLL
jgi:A/G-specific adenine glycosylase